MKETEKKLQFVGSGLKFGLGLMIRDLNKHLNNLKQ